MTATAQTSAETSGADVLRQVPARAYVVLLLALMAASFAAVSIRLAQMNGIPSPLIAAGRLTLAALILTPLVLRRYRTQVARLPRRDRLWTLAAGFWIGTHFTLLNFALENSSVLVVQVIVNTGPLWTALMEVGFLGRRLPRLVYGAILVSLAGGALIAIASSLAAAPDGADLLLDTGGLRALLVTEDARNPLLGAVFALGGAVAGAIYLTIGSNVRAGIAIVPYVWLVYGAGGLTAFIGVLLTGTPVLGHPLAGYGWLLFITLVPQLIGHSGFNYAVGYFPATVVTISTQIIAVTAGFIAFLLFAEVPTSLELTGSLVIGVGVLMAISAGRGRAS